MNKKIKYGLLLMAFLSQNLFAETIDVIKAGGKSDGQFMNTQVIAQSIERLSKNGGGTLYFPAGQYLTGPITFKSNITLYLESGAVLNFSDNFDDYLPYVEMRYEGVVMKSFHPLIYAYEAENIAIVGRGVLNGNGKSWWYAAWGQDGDNAKKRDLSKYQKLFDEANKDLKLEDDSDWKGTLGRRFFRPPFFQAYKSKNIRIEGVTFTNSPFWTINPIFCSNITIDGVTINNPISPNTDGINPSSCSHVHIANCHISVGDDCITIKSGRDKQGRDYGVPCENITVTNCTMLAGHGGVVIGSEMSGDVRKVTISNCVFDGTDRGIRIKSTRGRGGIVEDIRVSNIVMRNIQNEAITLNLFYSDVPAEPVSDRTPIFRNIHINGLTGVDINAAGTILGLPEMPISGVTLTDIDLQCKTGLVVNDATHIDLNSVIISAEKGSSFKFERVSEAQLSALKTMKPLANAPVVSLKDCQNVLIQNSFPLPDSESFLQLSGAKSAGIVLMNNYLSRLNKPVEKATDCLPNALTIVK
jgi:polygalacturonase